MTNNTDIIPLPCGERLGVRWYIPFFILLLCCGTALSAQDVVVTVNAADGKKAVSPYIYGRNGSFSNSFGTAASAADIALVKESGLRLTRENGGNNATKYNWRKKISSHPDWYNNVYDHDWDAMSKNIVANVPDMQVMWAFQLIGKVASNKNNNFNDWGYNQSQWWSGCSQNLAGGGTANATGGTTATINGNPLLYTMDWPADSTTEVLNHWFGAKGIGLNSSNFQYWNMDNEPEIWSGTHDDVMPTQIAASAFMDKYFAVAKKARALFPGIKLCGPVTANEWQWYNWGSETLNINGKYYCWLEYFLKRVADEQKATGIKLLDVVDLHWYPGETADADVLQLHRIFYDKTYAYPGANGVKSINGGWDDTQNKEYIFQRINDWLTTYFGANHGITVGLSESGINSTNANVNSVLYASLLGTFANNGVEIYTPWTWNVGMWETLHLFSRYAKNNSVTSTSTLENTVSGYTTVSSNADSMTVILVNRDLSATHRVTVNLSNFLVANGTYNTLQIAALPTTETFVSHTNNALKSSSVTVSGNSFTLVLPTVSTTAIVLKSSTAAVENPQAAAQEIKLFPNPAKESLSITIGSQIPALTNISVYSMDGKLVDMFHYQYDGGASMKMSTEKFDDGIYLLKIKSDNFSGTKKFCVLK
ncbi:MAG TPA: glycoside hydrolase family 44 protein [Paludibacter sp.]|nr:glycoside hydrolase family 44 protein [Paludibacter sp.]